LASEYDKNELLALRTLGLAAGFFITKKPYTLYDGDRANVAIRKPLLGD
jgi:hypothetical protein